MATASRTLEQYREEERAKNKAFADAEVGVSNSIYDTQKKNVQNLYQGQIRDTVSSYENALRSNETQRFLNSRAIERRMAEMGLTDSGLNRTQQTAVQLSAANNQGEIQRQRQAAVDTLARTMASDISAIEAERAAKEQSIRSGYTSEADSHAVSLYNADLQSATDIENANIAAAAKIQAAQIEAAQKAEEAKQKAEEAKQNNRYFYTGVKDEYGNMVYQNAAGDTRKVAEGYNPNGYNSKAMYADEYARSQYIKFADNGYQPLGLISERGNFEEIETTDGRSVDYNGRPIYITPLGNFLIWNDATNEYENASKIIEGLEKNGYKISREAPRKLPTNMIGA